MAKKMLIDATHPEETRVVVVDGARVEEFDYESVTKLQISGNIYLARVTRVEPSLQAAFVDYGGGRHGFLAFAEIHPDYYQIPKADREALLAAERAAAQAAADEDDDEDGGARSRRRRKSRSAEDGAEDRSRRNGSRRGGKRGSSGDEPRGPHRKALTTAAFDATQAPTLADGASWAHQADLTADEDRVAAAMEAFDAQPQTGDAADDVPADDGDAPKIATEADLADVSSIEITRATTAAERAATGAETVTETIDIAQSDAGDGDAPETGASDAAASEADDAESATGDLDGDESSEDDENGDDGDDDEDAVAEDHSPRRNRRRGRKNGASGNSDGDEDDDDNRIEEIGADDAREEIRPRRIRMRDYNIQEVVKRRQIMLVQVVKEERGTKGAALTTYLSLAGRYCVLMPNTARGGGISRKITNAADRKRLKSVVDELEVPEGMGLIVRTAGANRTKAEIKRDYDYLLRQWSAVRDLTLRSVAPCMIYEEGSLVKRAIRDLYGKDVDQVFVEGDEAYREAKDYMKMLMPSHARNVQPYREETPLFIKHQVESQMAAMLTPKVQLKSGGYLIIGVTEALVAIDVNSGKSTKESNIEETALKTNLEAADEIPRQLKLRDLAGLIVIDFIDMDESRNNRAVEKRLKERLKDDRARIQVGRISGFGLLEMSRQRLRPGLLEATTTCCPMCKGMGVVRSDESMSLAILRAVEEEGVRRRSSAVRVAAPVAVGNYLINHKRERVALIEDRYDFQVIVESDPTLVSPDYVIERVKPVRREPAAVERRHVSMDATYDDYEDDGTVEAESVDASEEAAQTGGEDREARRDDAGGKRKRKRRSGRRDDEGDAESAEAPEGGVESAGDDEAETGSGDGSRRRGRRGGRRRRRGSESDDPLPVIDLSAEEDADADDADAVEPVAEAAETVEAEVDSSDEAGVDEDRAESVDATPAAEDDAPATDKSAHEIAENVAETDAGVSPAAEGPDATEQSREMEPPAPPPPPRQVERDPSQPRRTGWWALRRRA